MNCLAVLVASAAVGVDFGWQPGEDGQLEYIIQIEPALVDAVAEGMPITSEIPPDIHGVRRFRIQVGEGSLPRKKPALPPESENEPPPAGEGSSDATPGRDREAEPTEDGAAAPALPDRGGAFLLPGTQPGTGSHLPDGAARPSDAAAGPSHRAAERPDVDTSPEGREGPVDPSAESSAFPRPRTGGERSIPPRDGGDFPSTDRRNTRPGSDGFTRESPGQGRSSTPGDGGTTDATAPPWGDPPAWPSRPSRREDRGSSTDQAADTSAGRWPTPPAFEPEPEAKPLDTEKASYSEPLEEDATSPSDGNRQEADSQGGSGRPWLPLTITLILLFASVGGNVYLAWIAWEATSRYRSAVTKRNQPAT